MNTLFLFVTTPDESGYECVKLSDSGAVLLPHSTLSFDKIREAQEGCTTVVVLSCTNASLFKLELPWLSSSKARSAIPFALEDKIAEPLDELHFSFDKAHYQNNHYLIAAIQKTLITHIMSSLTKEAIAFDAITLDWFALNSGDLVVSKDNILIGHDDFQGGISGTLASVYLTKHSKAPITLFQDSQLTPENPSHTYDEHSFVWIAKQLLSKSPMNLCQGTFAHGSNMEHLKKGFQLVGVLFAAWLCSILLVNGIHLYQVNKETAKIDDQIAVIYHEFFPNAKQVVSPKFRLSQLLQSNQNGTQGALWLMVSEFAKAAKGTKVELNELRYQNNHLTLTVLSPDFEQLQLVENKLKTAHIKVTQTQAAKQKQQVIATLELS